MNAKEYRDHLHQQRSHPHVVSSAPTRTDSFSSLYLSLFGFLAVEYFAEIRYDRLPSGIFFPVGFLFFWAFYYTYVQPGYLEQRMSSEKKWDLFGVPTTLMNTCIWFVKIVFVELTENMLASLLGTRQKPAPRAKAKPKAEPRSRPHRSVPQEPMPSSIQSNGLPREINNALQILGVPNTRDWNSIQKRYRELAKQYHPDLNPDLTRHGNRFMIYDAAYRRLEAVKGKHFQAEKRKA